jgi:hypothetical protein
VADGVHHEVLHDPLDLWCIDRHDDGLGLDEDRPLVDNIQPLDRPADDGREIQGPHLRRHDPSREAVDVEEIGRHLLDQRAVPALRLMPRRALASVRTSLHQRKQRKPRREEDERTDGLADLTPEPFVDPAIEGFEQPGRRAEHDEQEQGEQDPQQIPQRRGPAARATGSIVHGGAEAIGHSRGSP